MVGGILGYLLHVDHYLGIVIKNYSALIYPLLFLVIFVETGFVLIPFLPGDSLLFIAGTFAATGALNIYLLLILFSSAAIFGDTINYWLGNYFGEKIFKKYIKKDYLDRAKEFYEKHGAKTIIISRFIPVLRSFAPFVAGISKMKYPKFFVYNIIGGISWVFIFVFAGYFFGTISFIKNNLTIFIIVIIILSFIPAIMEYLKYRKNNKN